MSATTQPEIPKLDVAHTPENDAYDALQPVKSLPIVYRLRGSVVNGFGRGSRLLGCPTANLDPTAFKDKLIGVERGVYMGWAQVGKDRNSPVYKTVLSLGTNPTFDTQEETVEAYILHEFAEDFYGEELSLLICGFMRSSEKFSSLPELIRAISRDVRIGDRMLDQEPYRQYRDDAFFKQ